MLLSRNLSINLDAARWSFFVWATLAIVYGVADLVLPDPLELATALPAVLATVSYLTFLLIAAIEQHARDTAISLELIETADVEVGEQ